jgi:hypothetical protein
MASERKPIRIFMIDGRNDNRGVNADGKYDQTRDWFYQNVRLKDALVAIERSFRTGKPPGPPAAPAPGRF